jgi:hypothetical protein
MTDNYSYQTSLSTSDQSDRKNDHFAGLADESTVSETAVAEVNFRGVMSAYEMEILTRLFPKCAQTLAAVLRDRAPRLKDEL